MKKKIRKPRGLCIKNNDSRYDAAWIEYGGKESITIWKDFWSAKEARRLAKWLLKASDYLEQKERER